MIWSVSLLRTLTIKGRWAVWVLLVFAMATALTVLDTVVWWRDGPRYTHRMWHEDRMDRIREDDKLRARIEALEARRSVSHGFMADDGTPVCLD